MLDEDSRRQGPALVGRRVEIPVHCDLWMQGARFGEVVSFHPGAPGKSAFVKVKMDNPRIQRLLKVWAPDWQYMKRAHQ